VGSLLMPLLKKVTPIVGSRMLSQLDDWSCFLLWSENHDGWARGLPHVAPTWEKLVWGCA
jgi:hypothetical protein